MFKKVSFSCLFLLISLSIGDGKQIVKAETRTSQVNVKNNDNKSICTNQLTSAINNVVNREDLKRSHWGILIKNLSSGETIYSQNAEKYFTPASNIKLFTTAVALTKLGSDFRFRTAIYDDGNGVLRVVGSGDPSLKNPQLQLLSQQLFQSGIKEINKLIADDSSFQGDLINSSWEWEDIQSYYGTQVNSLILNENAISLTLLPQKVGDKLQLRWDNSPERYHWKIENNTITTASGTPGFINIERDLKGQILRINGKLPIDAPPEVNTIAVFDPATNFLREFRQVLANQGISVKETLINNDQKNNNNSKEIAVVASPPLSELLLETNINSNNLYAEVLLRTLASKQPLGTNETTANLGLKVIKETLTDLGIEPQGYMIVDGSGLSRKNLVTPTAIVQLLQAMEKSPQKEIFRASLPISGVSGTLKNRFLNTNAVGIIQAKTGTMTGISNLSGYINTPNYQPLVFSIMVNQYQQPNQAIRTAIDQILVLLTDLKQCDN
ncbi:D-alanyl-D-alanine carboxypeptidase/D-alanyl-D-alanine-endopeptidase [Anabaena sp. FACHB-1237]|nr:D-alanyl-D-alanine carboxypeptidase/D-alanyl-D-alanine-endopeptidase [Anabaena sp. FACHB-1237]